MNDKLERPSPVSRNASALRALALQFMKFGTVGVIGFVIDFTFLHIGMKVFGFGPVQAAFFSFPFAVTATWIGNRLFTFKDVQHEPAAKQLSKFVAVCAVGLIFNRGTYTLLVTHIPLFFDYPILGLIAGTGVGMFFNFFAARRHVFGSST